MLSNCHDYVEIACKVIVPFTGLMTAFLSSVSAQEKQSMTP
jgi:hypothetical protein